MIGYLSFGQILLNNDGTKRWPSDKVRVNKINCRLFTSSNWKEIVINSKVFGY